MIDKKDASIIKDQTEELTTREIKFREAYALLMRPIHGLSSMVENSTNKKDSATRKALITNIQERLEKLASFLPPDVKEKESFELKDIAENLKYMSLWGAFDDDSELYKKDLSDEEALFEAHTLKLFILDEEKGMDLNDIVDSLKNLAPDPYEAELTNLHCNEAVNAFNNYKKLVVLHYFTNDPFEHGEEMHKGLNQIAEKLGIDLTKQDFVEETLLKMAGIDTQHQQCQYKCNDPHLFQITIKGINTSVADAFIKYLGDVTKDTNASYKLVDNGAHETTNKETGTYCFSVDIKKAKELLLPAFTTEVLRIENENPAAFDHYRVKAVKRNAYAFHSMPAAPTEDLFHSAESIPNSPNQ
ncbi:MAG: hypothetical protein EPN84_12000 [Legionella sp.]|nr:MAG: hypothetical protein EPN84_12000 [Legionella sp.]